MLKTVKQAALLIVLSLASLAQLAAEPVSEPEEIGILVRQVSAQQFQPLEMLNALPQSDTALLGGTLEYFTIPGSHSPVRFKAGEPVLLYIRSNLNPEDPRAALVPVTDPTLFALFRAREEGDNRRILLDDDGASSHAPEAGKPLIARPFGRASFVVAPVGTLSPGEYAVQYPLSPYSPTPGSVHPSHGEAHGSRLYCFGVDP